MPSYRIDKPTCPKHPYSHLSGDLGCVLCNGEDIAARQKMRGTSTGKKRRGKFDPSKFSEERDFEESSSEDS